MIERFFADLHDIISIEPVNPHDKVMMGMLASLGIEKGEPFAPDETAQRAMRQAAVDVWFYLQHWFDNFPKDKLYWPDRHYASLLQADVNKTFTFVYDDRIDLPVQLDSTAGSPLPAMRFYGGTEELNNKTFKMPDFEAVN